MKGESNMNLIQESEESEIARRKLQHMRKKKKIMWREEGNPRLLLLTR